MAHHDSRHHHSTTVQELEHQLVEHDTWFRHDASESHHQASHGETNGFKIVVFLVVVIVFVFATAFAIIKYYNMAEQAEIVRKYDLRTPEFGLAELKAMREEWGRQLSSAGWVDPGAKVVRLPMDLAARAVVEEYRTKK